MPVVHNHCPPLPLSSLRLEHRLVLIRLFTLEISLNILKKGCQLALKSARKWTDQEISCPQIHKKGAGFDDFGASNLQNRRHQLAGASWGLCPLWLYLPCRSCALDSIDLSICQRYMTLTIELINALGIRPLHDVQTWTSHQSSTITYHFRICPPLSFHWRLNPKFVQIQTFLDPDNIISLRKALIILFSECLILTVSLSFLFETCCALSQNCELCGLTPCAECVWCMA